MYAVYNPVGQPSNNKCSRLACFRIRRSWREAHEIRSAVVLRVVVTRSSCAAGWTCGLPERVAQLLLMEN